MPVLPGAIDRIQPITILLAPARPLPAAPQLPQSNRPVVGEANSPRIQALQTAATARVRGPIGSVATVGGNAATIGAPGIGGLARRHASLAANDAIQSIGKNVDRGA
jgi:hypothetical protein